MSTDKLYVEDLIDAKVTESEVFEYLNELRESGITNMLGATPYVASTFGLTTRSSRELLLAWMESF